MTDDDFARICQRMVGRPGIYSAESDAVVAAYLAGERVDRVSPPPASPPPPCPASWSVVEAHFALNAELPTDPRRRASVLHRSARAIGVTTEEFFAALNDAFGHRATGPFALDATEADSVRRALLASTNVAQFTTHLISARDDTSLALAATTVTFKRLEDHS